MTAQIRHGAPTVKAAHALNPEPVDRITVGDALGYLFGGLALVIVAYLFAFFVALLGGGS